MQFKQFAAKRQDGNKSSKSPRTVHRTEIAAARGKAPARPTFIVDLEATCWDDRLSSSIDDMEIIEIGCVLVTREGTILDEFCTFVRPLDEPLLSAYCTSLTGIHQEEVDKAPSYREAMIALDQWMAGRLGIWGSWGNFDQRLFASMECRHPSRSKFLSIDHVNLKRPWKQTNGTRRTALRAALEHHGLNFIGRPHRGIDDARNIARLMPFVDHHKLLAAVGALGPITENSSDSDRGAQP
ncbi:MAG: exonuclease domain-containing protein [Alcanivoracaceae bacterium]|nr:exonuclease domain-containing protein [Alcanivoracaceae bacterium]